MTMVEKVARAMWENDLTRSFGAWETVVGLERKIWLDRATVALTAAREPSARMIKAYTRAMSGDLVPSFMKGRCGQRLKAVYRYRAMIDAELDAARQNAPTR